VARLEAILAQAIDLIEATMDRRVRFRAGAGAAGGLGAGLMAFLGAELRPGIDLVLEASGFADSIQGAQLVLTGEGRIDQQTSHGKTIHGVARLSQRQGVPVVAIVGSIGAGADLLYRDGLTSIISLVPGPVSLEDAMAQGPSMVADTAERVMRLFLAREIGADPGG
jgi:glycerate kinase